VENQAQSSPDQTSTTPEAHTTLPFVPTSWPGAFGLYKYSKQVIKLNLSTFLTLMATSILLGIVSSALERAIQSVLLVIVTVVVFEILSAIVSIAFYVPTLVGTKGEKVSVSESFARVTPRILISYIGIVLVSIPILVLSLVFLVIPFFFVAPRLSLAGLFVLDQNMGPFQAIAASWHATKGNIAKIWGIVLANIVMFLPALTIIGIPVSIYLVFMYGASLTLLYRFASASSATRL